jgi:hypothetical protein
LRKNSIQITFLKFKVFILWLWKNRGVITDFKVNDWEIAEVRRAALRGE